MKKFWTDEQREKLKALYPTTTAADLAALFGRSLSSIYDQANSMGLKKSPEFFDTPAACRLDGQRGASTRYRKGDKPWNDGKSYQPGGRSIETRFKKGRPPQESRNYQPIGSFRISRDGILEQKVSDNPTISPARRWVSYQRIVWEQDRGAIPDGHIVRFLPGCKTTDPTLITVDKLECISKAENARRNTIHRYPPEIKDAMRLLGKLRRKINEKSD